MSIRQIAVTIPNGETYSKWISAKDFTDNGTVALVGIATPAAVDAVALRVDYSIDGSTALTAVGTDGTAKTLTQTADDYIVLPPAEYPLIPGYFRLGVASATAAARTYTVFGRDV